MYVTTAGLGRREFPHPLSPSRIREGDRVIVSGPVGAHGLAVLAARESLPVGKGLVSDAAFLYPSVKLLFALGEGLRFMRDATRGGLAAVLNEAVQGTGVGMEVEEAEIPIAGEALAVSSLLGVNPLETANEGVFVAVVAPEAEVEALRLLRSHPLGREARGIGRLAIKNPQSVMLTTRIGGRRVLDFPRGLLLPRIC